MLTREGADGFRNEISQATSRKSSVDGSTSWLTNRVGEVEKNSQTLEDYLMRDLLDEALDGVCLAYAIVHPDNSPDDIPIFSPDDDEDHVFSIMREYVEVCRTSLDVSGVPAEAAPAIGIACGFFECWLFCYDGGKQGKVSEAQQDQAA
jgi:hypothetical protein